MEPDRTLDIFISYSHEDKTTVLELVKLLEDRGWSVWWDRDINVGGEFALVIEKALLSAKCIVAVWSRHSVVSPWVRSEAQEGIRLGNLIPLALDESRPPLPFRSLETAQLDGWPEQSCEAGLHKLFSSITTCVSGEREHADLISPLDKMRADPTLSKRVATRVIDELAKGRSGPDNAILLERAVTDFAVKLYRTKAIESSIRHLTSDLCNILKAEIAIMRWSAKISPIVDLLGVNDPATLFMESESNVLLDAPGNLKDIGATWRLTIGRGPGQIVLVGTSDPPAREHVERLEIVASLLGEIA